MSEVVRIQIHHDRLNDSNPYPPQIESALTDLKNKGLKERGWDDKSDPGVIRHETGAEIIVLVTALVELTSTILHLIAASKRHRPETKISITVNNPADFSRILKTLAKVE